MHATIKDHNLKAAAMWSAGGRAYDDISRSIAAAIDHCVTRLNPTLGQRVADVATGTGWTSRQVARRGANVVGVDFAEGMLTVARDIAREQHLAIDYRIGDAEALPFEDGELDAVISTFGVMFAPDQQRVAAELARVCRRGGRIAIAAWTPNSQVVTLRQLMIPFMPAPPASPPPSPFVWGTREWLKTTLGHDFRLGFEEGTSLSRFPSVDAAWDAHATGFPPVIAVMSGLDAERQGALKSVFGDWAKPFCTGLGITIPFDYLITVGERV
jgi:SAM-dependent methyltransferase